MKVDNIKRALLFVLLSLTLVLCACGTSDTNIGQSGNAGNGISASGSMGEGITNGGGETSKEEPSNGSSTQKPDEEKENNSSIGESGKSEIEFPEITLP